MAEAVKLVGEPRQAEGSSVARRLRRGGRVPAVLYGHKEAVLALSVLGEDLDRALRHGVRVVDLQLSGKNEQALVHEVQYDPFGKDVIHVDFRRVSKDERVVVTVRLELRGHAPGVTAGGVLDQPMHNVSVDCLALSLPDSIRVNVGELQIGSVIHVRDLVLPPDVKVMADPDAVVVQVKQPEAEAAPASPLEAGAAAEPEVITRRAAEGEGEEEKK